MDNELQQYETQQQQDAAVQSAGNEAADPDTYQVPKGYQVVFSSNGVPYLEKVGDDSSRTENEIIENEHHRPSVNIFAFPSTVERQYGLSVRLYFDFLYYITAINVVLFIIHIPLYIHHLASNSFISDFVGKTKSLNPILYSAFYNPSVVWYWRVVNILCMIVSLVSPLGYFLIVKIFFRRRNETDFENSVLSDDRIQENGDISIVARIGRFCVSYLVFFGLLLIQLVIVSVTTMVTSFRQVQEAILNAFNGSSYGFLGVTIGISILVNIANTIFGSLVVKLTAFEKHPTWTGYRRNFAFKSMLFQLLNVAVMIAARGFFTLRCMQEEFGSQLFTQIVVDVTLNNALEIVIPLIKFFIQRCITKGNYEAIRPEFSVPDEHLEAISRQATIYIGITSFPMISFLGIIACILEIIVDKMRLFYICAKPHKAQGSMKSTMSLFLFLAAFFAIFNPGAGNIYTLVGKYWCNPGSSGNLSSCAVCAIFEPCKTNLESCFSRIF